MISTSILRLSGTEVVLLLRAEIESANGQPDLYFTISKEYVREGDFDDHANGIDRDAEFDFVTEFALLTIEPRVERDYWTLRVEFENPLGLRPHYDEAGLLHKYITLDEFEGELTVSNPKKRITVRLEADTAAARTHFDRWLSEIRRRHPSRLQAKELRNKRVMYANAIGLGRQRYDEISKS